jgi:ATP-dependent Lon protease
MQTSVFATSNHARKISAPLKSRFFILELEAYTYEQFCKITAQVLSRQKVEEAVAKVEAMPVCIKTHGIIQIRWSLQMTAIGKDMTKKMTNMTGGPFKTTTRQSKTLIRYFYYLAKNLSMRSL